MILGHLSRMWVSLHNARPRNLRGFGEVAPALYEALDPQLMRIIDQVNAMLSEISKPR